MRKVIVSNLISLDGYFEGPNKEFDFFSPDDDFYQYSISLLDSIDTLLFGKVTYEMMASYWPDAPAKEAQVAKRMNSLKKFVFSTTLRSTEWNNSTMVKGDAAEEVIKLKEQEGKDMVIFGSQKLMLSLMQKNLIDEYQIIINPLLLGKGHTLFNGLDKRMKLQLLKVRTLTSGIVILDYKPI